MGYDYKKNIIDVPAWRADVLHEVDLIEDIAIAYGYENFVSEIPEISTIGQETQKEIIKRKISEILIGLGMLETSNYHLTKKRDQFTKMGIPKKQEKGFVELEESKTDFTILRKDLTHYLLKILSENVDVEYPQKIFEIGKVFEQKQEIIETEKLSAAISPGNFTEIKQVLEYLLRMIGLKIEIREVEEAPKHFINGRCAEIILIKEKNNLNNNYSSLEGGRDSDKKKKKKIGFIGEIHPKILKNWRIKMPVALFEINLKEIFKILV